MSQDSAATNPPSGQPAPGELCWLEVPCVDPERAFSFYQAVFGWEKPCNADGGIPGYGEGIESIHMFMHGKLYGAFVKMSNADNVAVTVDRELPFKMAITPYLLVADIDKTAEVVAASGGKVHVPKFECGPGGAMGHAARFIDTEGNVVAVWTPPVGKC
ncbi:hypothetical protein QBC39DRAFT_369120 [Podospora conica]|nr:hypothetical protein QBC39DRAFT_369120 [Schizothecium conicum]